MLQDKWALIIEDDAHSLVAISSILRDLGIRFKRNTTGLNVAEQMRAMHPAPDFVLLDVELTIADAAIILRRIQADTQVRGIPVIAYGANQDFSVRQRLKHAGYAAYLSKPLPRRQLGEVVQRVLDGETVWEAAI